MVLNYDPSNVSIIFGGIILSGYDDGTFVTIARNNDMFSLKMGADGIGARAKSSDRSGRVTATLLQTSPVNDQLSAIAIADELTGEGVLPLLVRDGSGTTVASGLSAWIVKMPDAEFGKDIGNRVWVFESDKLQIHVGGNSLAGAA